MEAEIIRTFRESKLLRKLKEGERTPWLMRVKSLPKGRRLLAIVWDLVLWPFIWLWEPLLMWKLWRQMNAMKSGSGGLRTITFIFCEYGLLTGWYTALFNPFEPPFWFAAYGAHRTELRKLYCLLISFLDLPVLFASLIQRIYGISVQESIEALMEFLRKSRDFHVFLQTSQKPS